MVLDEKRGMVFAPTGSAVSDFYGADRIGDNLYANSLLALDANTGKLIWHFQGVRHDIADRDFPSPPVLLTLKRDGKPVEAVAQASKQGYLFVLDRLTGKPLFPVSKMAVPPSDVPGEKCPPPSRCHPCRRLMPASISARACSPTARRRPINGRWSNSALLPMTDRFPICGWDSRVWLFPVSTAARNGAARPPIRARHPLSQFQ